jgi:hypothetical protein
MTTTSFGEYYRTGTITLVNNSVDVAGSGVLWTDIEQGDILEAQGLQATIDTVSETSLTLMLPWVGAGGAGLAYVIRKDAKSRFDPALTQAKLRAFLLHIADVGIFMPVAGAAPDDGDGEDGQYALKVNDGAWSVWFKESGFWVFQGVAAGGLVYDVGGFSPDRPGSNENVLSWLFCRTVTFPVNLTGSKAKAGTAATSSAVFSIQKNGVQIGTITVAAGQTVGTFSLASETTFGAPDVLDIIGPSPRDATLANMHITLSGLRT